MYYGFTGTLGNAKLIYSMFPKPHNREANAKCAWATENKCGKSVWHNFETREFHISSALGQDERITARLSCTGVPWPQGAPPTARVFRWAAENISSRISGQRPSDPNLHLIGDMPLKLAQLRPREFFQVPRKGHQICFT